MKHREFDRRVKKHLSEYKKDVLRIDESGSHNGQEEGYILPNDIDENFIDGNDLLIKKYYDKNRTHLYSNHLCSSQIMCINFFLPLLKNEELLNTVIARALEIKEDLGSLVKREFEHRLDFDGKSEIDLYLEYENGMKIYIQTKYIESNFGEFLDNQKSRAWDEKYSKFLSESLYLKDLTKDEFFKNYELNRNIGLIRNKNDYVIFVYPSENESLKNIISEIELENVKEVDWNEITYSVLQLLKGSSLEDYYREFSRKYLNY